jgi:radical SAM protein (TIGR01212 family)
MLNICTVGQYWKEKFGEKVYRVGIDGGFTCPTRDGTKGVGGCYFCDEEGSRESYIKSSDGIENQIEAGICKLKKRGINRFISYFQSYTSTYAPVDVLKEKYSLAFSHPDVVGISVSTRPDCINKENINLLNKIADEHYTIVELGIQSVHQKSLDLAGRKHTVQDSKEAVDMLKKGGKIEVVAHVILGLPGETESDMIETAKVLSSWGIHGVKLHHLYIVEGTPFSKKFLNGDIKVYENPEDYAEVAREFISNLSDNIIIHRFAGYASTKRLIAPEWTRDRHIARNIILEMF